MSRQAAKKAGLHWVGVYTIVHGFVVAQWHFGAAIVEELKSHHRIGVFLVLVVAVPFSLRVLLDNVFLVTFTDGTKFVHVVANGKFGFVNVNLSILEGDKDRKFSAHDLYGRTMVLGMFSKLINLHLSRSPCHTNVQIDTLLSPGCNFRFVGLVKAGKVGISSHVGFKCLELVVFFCGFDHEDDTKTSCRNQGTVTVHGRIPNNFGNFWRRMTHQTTIHTCNDTLVPRGFDSHFRILGHVGIGLHLGFGAENPGLAQTIDSLHGLDVSNQLWRWQRTIRKWDDFTTWPCVFRWRSKKSSRFTCCVHRRLELHNNYFWIFSWQWLFELILTESESL